MYFVALTAARVNILDSNREFSCHNPILQRVSFQSIIDFRRKVEILHIITTLCRGGAEMQLKVLVREQLKGGNIVMVSFLKGKPDLIAELTAMGAIVDESLRGKSFLHQIVILRSKIKNYRGIVHAHLPRAELIAAICLGNSRLIVSRHNAEPFFPRAPKFISIVLSRFVQHRSNSIICISVAVKNYVLQSREISNGDKIRVIYYGFDVDLPIVNITRGKNVRNKFVVGTIARLVPQKDLTTLLRAFSAMKSTIVGAELLIVGEGYLQTKLRKEAERLNISDSVSWIGKTDKVADEIQKMDLFVLPSKYEGFGMVMLEAIQLGKAVVAARNSAIPEVLGTDSKGLFATGNFVDLETKLLRFHNDDERFELILTQRKRLRIFDPQSMYELTDVLYRQVNRGID